MRDQRQIAERLIRKRKDDGLTLRDAQRSTGVSYSSLWRLENGFDLDFDNIVLVAKWLDCPLEDNIVTGIKETPDAICDAIRADATLSPRSADFLCEMMRAAYKEFRANQ